MRSAHEVLAKAKFRFRRHVLDPVQNELRRRRNTARDLTPIFVSGAMGSGTTFLAFELAQRFDVAGVVEESALEISPRSFLRMPAISSFQSIDAYEERLWPDSNWSESEGVDALQDLYRSRAHFGQKHIIDKGPNTNLVRAAFLASCFPDAKFVLLFRDPVANIEGFRRKWPVFGRSSLGANIQFYRRIHEAFLEQAESFADRTTVVSYEQFTKQHPETLEILRESLHLDFASHKSALPERPNQPGQGIRNISDNQIGIVNDANADAYLGLSDGEIEQIRSELDPLHQRMRDAVSTN